jgi:predicted amidohydrolase YtcJ
MQYSSTATRRTLGLILVGMLAAGGCAGASSASASPQPGGSVSAPTTAGSGSSANGGDVLIIGRIVTMADSPVAEALLITDGTVAAVGARDDVRALVGDDVPVIDIGDNVAYPGFIDSHAHWIGDRNYYRIDTPAEAIDAAIRRGWTSISEQWVDRERIDELEALSADDALPLRVDAYLALNALEVGGYYGDWYADREPGPVDDYLHVQGLKIHLDSGSGGTIYWETDKLMETVKQANETGWQISVHAVSTEAMEVVLDAYEAAIGPTGPNPLHHRIEHALQVTDDHLARMVAMNLATVVQLDGAAVDWVRWAASTDEDGRDYEKEDPSWLGRWRDFVDAGLHVAGSSDAPWFFPNDFAMTDDVGRPVDEIAGGMDARGREFVESPPWMAEQLLTAEQGLRAVTVDAAWALRDEARRGHLAPGALGDVTILSGDVSGASPDEIRAFEVIATIVGGDTVFCRAPEVCGR